MSFLSFLKYTPLEKKLANEVQQWFNFFGYSKSEAKKLSFTLLDKCISDAEKEGLRKVTGLGDDLVKNKEFMEKRLNAGLTIEDIKKAWNPSYVWVLLQEEASNACNFFMFNHLIKEQDISEEEAVNLMRRSMPYFGDPENSHKNYQGEDADIYFEFRLRFDEWRDKYSSNEITKMAKEFSTYNAMIRHYIGKGEI